MFELIALGGVVFWILTAIFGCFVFGCVAEEKGWGAFWSIIIYVAIIAILSPFNLIGFLFANPLWILMMIGLYILCSMIASMGLWRNFIGKAAIALEEEKILWLEDKGIRGTKKIPDNLKKEWTQKLVIRYMRYHNSNPSKEALQAAIRPIARDHKNMILFWIAYWPICVLWELIGDWIVNVSKMVYRMIAGILDSMSARRFSAFDDDISDNSSSIQTKDSGSNAVD